jgi:hypothetical protein
VAAVTLFGVGRGFRLHSYRSLLALVQQDVFLFDGSVRDNMVVRQTVGKGGSRFRRSPNGFTGTRSADIRSHSGTLRGSAEPIRRQAAHRRAQSA